MSNHLNDRARIGALSASTAAAVIVHSPSFLKLTPEERQLYGVAVSDLSMTHEGAVQWVALASLKARVEGVSIFFAAGVLSPEEYAPHTAHFKG